MVSEFLSSRELWANIMPCTMVNMQRLHWLFVSIIFPRFADDALPTSALGGLLAVADRLDTLISIFSIGLLPTGDKDPLHLKAPPLVCSNYCGISVGTFPLDMCAAPLLMFFRERLKPLP